MGFYLTVSDIIAISAMILTVALIVVYLKYSKSIPVAAKLLLRIYFMGALAFSVVAYFNHQPSENDKADFGQKAVISLINMEINNNANLASKNFGLLRDESGLQSFTDRFAAKYSIENHHPDASVFDIPSRILNFVARLRGEQWYHVELEYALDGEMFSAMVEATPSGLFNEYGSVKR
jgi:hypothetical protein